MDQNNYIFEVEDLCKYFPAGKKKVVKAVDGINLKIRKGETIGVVGESGCGRKRCIQTSWKGTVIFQKGCSGHIPGSVCISGPTYDNRRDYQ